jgi:hypothetical protein
MTDMSKAEDLESSTSATSAAQDVQTFRTSRKVARYLSVTSPARLAHRIGLRVSTIAMQGDPEPED